MAGTRTLATILAATLSSTCSVLYAQQQATFPDTSGDGNGTIGIVDDDDGPAPTAGRQADDDTAAPALPPPSDSALDDPDEAPFFEAPRPAREPFTEQQSSFDDVAEDPDSVPASPGDDSSFSTIRGRGQQEDSGAPDLPPPSDPGETASDTDRLPVTEQESSFNQAAEAPSTDVPAGDLPPRRELPTRSDEAPTEERAEEHVFNPQPAPPPSFSSPDASGLPPGGVSPPVPNPLTTSPDVELSWESDERDTDVVVDEPERTARAADPQP